MKFVSWNVNGLRACVKKGFENFFEESGADILCVQETKLQEGQIDFAPSGYESYWNYAEKKGYSGTAVFTRKHPINAWNGIGVDAHDQEGRVITLEFEDFFFVTVYTPNSQSELKRLDYRMAWDDDFRQYIQELDREKPVVVTGDFNVAHEEIDLKNPKTNKKNAGFTQEERDKFTELLEAGFTDSFRYLHPEMAGAYTWWSYRFKAREKDAGWRIDYFLVSDRWKEKIKEAPIYKNVMGSDHCPIGLELDLEGGLS